MWPESVWGGEEIDVLVHDEDHEAVARASVAVDDDPEEAGGCETVGRTRRGRNKDSRPGRVSEEFATVLEEFELAVSQPAELLRITVFILRAQRSAYRLGPFFLECWQVSLKFLRLVPIQLGWGQQVYSPTRPNPTHLNWLKTLEKSERMSKIIFLRLRDNCFLHGNRFKSWVILWIFFTPDSLMTHNLCVSIAQKIQIHTGKMPKWLIIYFAPLSIQKVKN